MFGQKKEEKRGSSLPTGFAPVSELTEQRWRNRIVGFDPAVDPNDLLANPANWRIHPVQQQEVLSGVFDEVGIVGGIVVNRNTGHIVDGHLRAMLALRNGQRLPVQYVDLSLEEEEVILATYDVVTSMAASDLQKVSDLVGGIKNVQNDRVKGVLDQMKGLADQSLSKMQAVQTQEIEEHKQYVEATKEISPIMGLREDAVFPGHGIEIVIKGDFGIPAIRPDLLARAEDIPSRVWDGVEKIDNGKDYLFVYGANVHPPEGKGGTLCFYVEDQRFEVVWADAVRIIAKLKAYGYSSCVAPNFSLYADDPLAFQIYNVYRAAWCARYWQEAGLRVMPDMNNGGPASYDVAMKQIPRGADVVAMQVRTMDAKKDIRQRDAFLDGVKYQLAYLEPKNVIIYGGLDHTWLQTSLPLGPKYHFLDSFMGVRGRHGLLGKSRVKSPKLSLRTEKPEAGKKPKGKRPRSGAVPPPAVDETEPAT